MSDPNRNQAAAFFIGAGLALGACAGVTVYLIQTTLAGGSAEAVDHSWLGEKTPAATVQASSTTRAVLQPPRSRGVRRMPDVTLTTIQGDDVKLYQDGVPPAVVTEFLIGCADCRGKFDYFPKLVPAIRDAGEEVVNVAYMGNPARVRRFLEGKDFGGPVHIDKGSQLQRHFGIGTFTVWLLDRQGNILFQGTPQQAEGHMADAFALRRQQALPSKE